jgi:predicted O-linked N-acetylglucosamine transferase (SPINDLY family)
LLVFARKPAPVQVTFLGSLTTTGLSTMDYRLTDRHLCPADSPEEGTEELVRLPGCFVCYQSPPGASDVAPLPSAKTGHVTFGSFNNLAKVTQNVVALWSSILQAVPESCLMLKERTLVDPGQRDRLCKLFEANGISARRLVLLPTTLFPAHLASYGQVDIALDPFPYNGCYTSCEALWMGVPVVTLAGNTTYGRYGVSLLTTLGLTRHIAATPEAYVTIAVKLAKNRRKLAALRAELRPRMAASLLCNTKGYAQGVEDAYRMMWRRWCRN